MNQIQFNNQPGEERQQEEEVNLKEYYRIIKRHIKLIIAIFIVVMAATIYHTIKSPKIYESSGKVLLELNKQTELFMPTSGFGRNELNNQMQVVQSRPVMDRAIEKLSRHPEADKFPLLAAKNPVAPLQEKWKSRLNGKLIYSMLLINPPVLWKPKRL